ncbi:MAG: alpha-amylase family glycosyl hydrolase [Synechococcaceae cyanobacterium]
MSHPLPCQQTRNQPAARWDGGTAVLIAYPDGVQARGMASLEALGCALDGPLAGLFPVVHVLPFLRSSGDGGFAISDHERLEPRFGDWQDLACLGRGRQLMADLVLNHVSATHPWVQDALRSPGPGGAMVLERPDGDGWEQVVRPRSTPLFTRFHTPGGARELWTTFGPDQVDVNWRNPAVLEAFVAQMDRLLAHGVRWLRLDAVGFLWKQSHTGCIHLPQVHDLVRVLRLLLEKRSGGTGTLVSETNVPQAENLSYVSGGDEAHLAYNFPLPPLLLEALLSGRADLLAGWLRQWPPLPPGSGLLNFAASHDGIGLRPLEGLMPEERLQVLLEACERRGGRISRRRQADGRERPYELNIAWWSAMGGPGPRPDPLQLPRHLCSLLLLLALPGVPAFYLPALLASANDQRAFARSGHPRDLNRPRCQLSWLERQLESPRTPAARIAAALRRALAVRARLPALAPDAPLTCAETGNPALLLLQRGRGAETLSALHNVSASPQPLPLDLLQGCEESEGWWEHLSGSSFDAAAHPGLAPFAVLWLQRQRPGIVATPESGGRR